METAQQSLCAVIQIAIYQCPFLLNLLLNLLSVPGHIASQTLHISDS
jgi:hypothetical protein